MEREQNRRRFLQATVVLGAVEFARAPEQQKQKKAPAGEGEEEVSPAEDLMREHGVLKRVLLVYGEALRRLNAREDLPPEALADSAKIIRSFIEDYHEKLEEDFLFPRFRKANTLVDLVEVLLAAAPRGTAADGHDAASLDLEGDPRPERPQAPGGFAE